MSGTLNLTLSGSSSVAGQKLRFSSADDCFVSTASVRFLRRPTSQSAKNCKASIRAFTTDIEFAVVDSRRRSSLYEVLQVNQNASPMEIKSAYRSLAKLYHPDSAVHRSESNCREFIEIHNAYATLSDPSARALYDRSLMAAHRRRCPFSSPIQNNSTSGFYTTRRWETDQCW